MIGLIYFVLPSYTEGNPKKLFLNLIKTKTNNTFLKIFLFYQKIIKEFSYLRGLLKVLKIKLTFILKNYYKNSKNSIKKNQK